MEDIRVEYRSKRWMRIVSISHSFFPRRLMLNGDQTQAIVHSMWASFLFFVAQFTHNRGKRLHYVCGKLWLWYELGEITINMTRLLLLFSLLSFQCHFISNKKKCSTAEMCLSSCFTSSTENYHQRKWGKSKPGKSDAMCTIVCCQSLKLLTLNGQLNRSIAAAALIPPTTDEGSQLFHAEMLSVGTFLTTATWKWDLVGISAEKLTRWF